MRGGGIFRKPEDDTAARLGTGEITESTLLNVGGIPFSMPWRRIGLPSGNSRLPALGAVVESTVTPPGEGAAVCWQVETMADPADVAQARGAGLTAPWGATRSSRASI